MPEFQLDYGDQHERFKACDEFTQGYITRAFFCGVEGIELGNLHLGMLSEEAWVTMLQDCNAFQLGEAAPLAAATAPGAAKYARCGYTMEYAGHDFWYSRNGHGAGYFCRGLHEDIEEELVRAAHATGECDLYVGDDGRLYLS